MGLADPGIGKVSIVHWTVEKNQVLLKPLASIVAIHHDCKQSVKVPSDVEALEPMVQLPLLLMAVALGLVDEALLLL